MRKLLLGFLMTAAAQAASAQGTGADRFQEVADRLVESINASNYAAIQSDFAEIMAKALPLEKTAAIFQGLTAQNGKIVKLDPPRLTPPSQAIFPAHFERAILDIKIVLDAQDKICGLWLLAHTPDLPAPERNTVALALPFKGEWRVVWGGDTVEQNQHHDVPNQRLAFDFVAVDESGRDHSGPGQRNEDFFAFGREILAPAEGVVTDAIDGVRDNTPGSMNPYSGLGNAVFLQHAEHEVSVLAHLKPGSLRVKAGDRVAQGQVIALCGNSGNSSQPHLHCHLQNTPIIQDAVGIKCFFDAVRVQKNGDRSLERQYSPVKGDIVGPEAASEAPASPPAGAR